MILRCGEWMPTATLHLILRAVAMGMHAEARRNAPGSGPSLMPTPGADGWILLNNWFDTASFPAALGRGATSPSPQLVSDARDLALPPAVSLPSNIRVSREHGARDVAGDADHHFAADPGLGQFRHEPCGDCRATVPTTPALSRNSNGGRRTSSKRPIARRHAAARRAG